MGQNLQFQNKNTDNKVPYLKIEFTRTIKCRQYQSHHIIRYYDTRFKLRCKGVE